MYRETYAVFPLLGPAKPPKYTDVYMDSHKHIIWCIKAILDPSLEAVASPSGWQLLCIDSITGDYEHYRVGFTAKRSFEQLHLFFYAKKECWILGGIEDHVIVGECDYHHFHVRYEITSTDIGLGYHSLQLFTQWRNTFFHLISTSDLTEEHAPDLYAIWYNTGTETKRVLFLGHPVLAMAKKLEDTLLLFQCERITASATTAQSANRWYMSITAYSFDGILLHKERLTDISAPITRPDASDEEALAEFPYQITIADDLFSNYGENICVVALTLETFSGSINQHINKGGLYLVTPQGTIVGHEPVALGTHMSLCVVGEHIIGTDRKDGITRYWIWSPKTNRHVTFYNALSQRLCRRVSVLAMPDTSQYQQYFWLLEEDTEGITISLKKSPTMHTISVHRYDRVQLIDHPEELQPNKKTLGGYVTSGDTLFLVCIYEHKQLQLLKIQP